MRAAVLWFMKDVSTLEGGLLLALCGALIITGTYAHFEWIGAKHNKNKG